MQSLTSVEGYASVSGSHGGHGERCTGLPQTGHKHVQNEAGDNASAAADRRRVSTLSAFPRATCAAVVHSDATGCENDGGLSSRVPNHYQWHEVGVQTKFWNVIDVSFLLFIFSGFIYSTATIESECYVITPFIVIAAPCNRGL